MIIDGIVIADIHFGKPNTKILMDELKEIFISKIMEYKKLDLIVIAGDLFDSKLYYNSEALNSAVDFVEQLLFITKPLGTRIFIVEGTRSHDNLQPTILTNRIADIRLKCFDTVSEYSMYKGEFNMLFLPEEYVVDQNEYYKDYFDKSYDMIFGHGMVDKMWFSKTNKTELPEITQVPIFKVEDLARLGVKTYFGHIHMPKNWDTFSYVGSFTRWCQGEEEPKGFIKFSFNTESKVLEEEFIENYLAPIYITRTYQIESFNTLTDLNIELDKFLDKFMSEDVKLRLIINVPTDVNNFNVIKNFLINKFLKDVNIKLIISNINKKEFTELTEAKEEEVKYNYLHNTSLNIEDQISLFIKDTSGKDMCPRKIKDYLETLTKR